MAAAPPTFDDLANDPALVALMPLLYVAWADGELTAEEVDAIHAAQRDRLGAAESAALTRWLSPESPPTSTELLRIYQYVQERLPELDVTTRSSLAELGLSLANLTADEGAEATRTALREVEAALGIEPKEAARELWAERPPVEQHFDEPLPPFEPADLTLVLDGVHREDWARVREICSRPELAYRYDVDKRTYREAVLDWLQVLAAEGLGRLGFPKADGGEERLDRFVKTFEALGMHDLSLVVKYGVQFGLFGGAILNLGTERHHRAYLKDVGDGTLLGGFAMTELGHGSNVRDLETVARYEPAREVFVIHSPSSSSRKEWIGNAALHGRMMVVFAQLETGGASHGVHAFMVPVRDEAGRTLPGVTISDCGQKMGLNGVDNGRLLFDHVEVPRDALLDRYATVAADGTYDSPIASPSRRFFTMLGTLVGGRIGVASASVTAAKSALTIAIRYGALRRQFGPADGSERTILDYRTHQLRLLTRLAATYALHFTVDDLQARWRDHRGEDSRKLDTLAAVVKVASTWHAIDAAQMARECCGGMGFLSANRISETRKDVDVFATFEGDNTVLLQLAAKNLLSGYAKAFAHDFFGTFLREIRERAAVELLQRNPFAVRRTDDEHLLDPQFHAEALAFRTGSLLRSAAERMKKRLDRGMDGFDAAMDIQDHLQSLSLAHIEAHVFDCFRAAVDRQPDGPVRDALVRLRALHGVWTLSKGIGWFLENGYVETTKARALRRLVSRLAEEVRPMAVPLVDAFGIPDEVLSAPIAFEGYADGATEAGDRS